MSVSERSDLIVDFLCSIKEAFSLQELVSSKEICFPFNHCFDGDQCNFNEVITFCAAFNNRQLQIKFYIFFVICGRATAARPRLILFHILEKAREGFYYLFTLTSKRLM